MSPVGAALAASLQGAEGPVYVGFSGGLDSTVLLHAAAAARRVTAVHVNHGLHASAGDWQRHCAGVCAALGVEAVHRRVTVSRRGSLEAMARAERYRVFAELLAEPGGLLLLAHHRNDQTETALLRLLQGRGLYGMPARRPLGAGHVVRPFLNLPRQVLVDYAATHTLTWVEDPGNADESLDRNFLRHRVLPDIRRRWPGVDDAVGAALERARLADEFITARLGDLARSNSLAVTAVTARDPAERPELLRLWLSARGVPAPARGALTEFARQLEAAHDRQPALALAGLSLRRYRGRVYLVAPLPPLQSRYPLMVPGSLHLPHGELRVVADAAGFAAHGALEVRFRTGGERLAVGCRHHTVKHLLQEAGVPPWERDGHPLVYDTQGLAALPGIAFRTEAGSAAWQGRYRAEWHPR